jgi:hypothetical protein
MKTEITVGLRQQTTFTSLKTHLELSLKHIVPGIAENRCIRDREPLNNSSLNYQRTKTKNTIFRFLTFSTAYQPLKMVAHPCATEARINQSFHSKSPQIPSVTHHLPLLSNRVNQSRPRALNTMQAMQSILNTEEKIL